MSFFVLLLFPLAFLCLIWYVFLWDDTKAQARLRNIPYVNLGNLFLIFARGQRFERLQFEAIGKSGSKVLGTSLLGNFTILLAEPELISQVLSKEFTSFPNRRDFPISDPNVTETLTFAPVKKWKRLRSIIAPTFSAGKIKLMKPHIDETVKCLLENFALEKESVIDVKRFTGSYTMDTLCRIAFGLQIDSLIEKDNPVIVNAQKLFSNDINLPMLIALTAVFYLPKVAQLANIKVQPEAMAFFSRLSEKIILEKKAQMEMNQHQTNRAKDFIGLMLETEEENKVDHLENAEKPSKCWFRYLTKPSPKLIQFLLQT